MNNESDEWINWLEEAISKKHIKYYEYKYFANIQEIGRGGFAKVFRANWKNTDRCFAMKFLLSIDKNTLKEIIYELNIQREVDSHENIIKFYGITMVDPEDEEFRRHGIVMEYANNGNLQTYLERYFDKLTWNDKYNLAYQLSSAVFYLHEKDIIHRDLHPYNILMHQHTIKLCDFGLSRRLKESNSNSSSKLFGAIPYVDPKGFIQKYVLNKKSDVYSVGILLWVISSGQPPFYTENKLYDIGLAIKILQGFREEVVPNTPNGYVKIYTGCWDGEPDNRPTMHQVVDQLKQLINELSDSTDYKQYQQNSYQQSFLNDISVHGELSQIIQNFDKMNTKEIEIALIDELIDLIIKKLDKGKEENAIKQFILDYTNNKIQEVYNLLLNNQNSSNYIFLLGYFYHHGIGTSINKQKSFELYLKAADLENSDGINMLGYCYENGIGTNIDKLKAFNLYGKAANMGNSKAQYNLALMYENGDVVDKDYYKAFELYLKAAKMGNSKAQYNLALMYENGDVVDKDYCKAFELYKILAESLYLDGILKLGYCYDNGIGTSINKQKATELFQKAENLKPDKEDSKTTGIIVSGLVDLFIRVTNEGKDREQRRSIINNYLSLRDVTIEEIYEWLNNNHKADPSYEYFLGYLNFSGIGTSFNMDKAFIYFYKASLGHHSMSQYYLGICYEFGFGTKINEKLAFECYERSAKQGDSVVGKFALGICYEKGIGTVKSEPTALYWYQIAADNGHAIAQYYVGNFHQFGICVNIDYNKAFHYYSLSANNECSYSINMLGYCYLKGIGVSIDKSKAFELYLKSANMNNKIAQCNVAICYEDGVGTKKDTEKAMEWYKKLGNEYNESEKKETETKNQIIEQWKLNHGLFLDGYRIQPSKQAVFADDGDLDISLYKGDPIVYTNINDPDHHTNLLSLSGDNNGLNNALKQLDMCINFPVAEITYGANLLESVSKFVGDKEEFNELYGHFLASKFLAGGQLFIRNFTLASPRQISIFKFYLIWIYNSVKNNDETPFNNDPFDNRFLPRIETSGGEEIRTPKELANWMNSLYQDNMLDIISYNSLRTFLEDKLKPLIEKQPGVANYEEKLKLEEWIIRKNEIIEVEIAVADAAVVSKEDFISTKEAHVNYINLIRWINDFRLIKGLAVNELHIIGYSKRVAINFIEAPKVNLSDKSYFEMTNPTTQLEESLLLNNIFSIKNIKSFPFIKSDNDLSDKDSIHLIVKSERYEILINKDNIKPSEEFNSAIERALDNMKPFNALQDVFNEYGHLFPLKITLGKSLKNTVTTTFFGNFEKINLKLPISGSLSSYLKVLDIPYLLTQNGDVIEENDLNHWINNTNDELEIIELDEIISLYDILKLEQKRKIDIILNNNNDRKIIMTGINKLKDLDNKNTKHYKRVDIRTSLEDENYEVFGSIVSKINSKLDDFIVTFELYDLNGFTAIISKLTETNVNITECYIWWIIIGNPTRLSVFSPSNREFQVEYIKKSITLQPNKQIYSVKTPVPLSRGYTILINANYPSTNYELKNPIKLVDWDYNSINLQIFDNELSVTQPANSQANINVNLRICILYTDYKDLKIDHEEEKCSLESLGYTLTKENLKDNAIDKFDDIQNIIQETIIDDDIQDILSKVSNDKPNIYLQQYNKQVNISKQLNLSKQLNISKKLNLSQQLNISKKLQEKDQETLIERC
ncbi:kinase-like domain-containing protein [Rhizophagus clarus]|uniref:Kinase-like domain-containing protein n=1 Tax=Rhizophagus clarus TaxID=94130 RepID=A0A8H3QGP6_9GLOM|nr:kinase-like domain-containing protein [Rhizophagus clarus]